MQFSTGGRFPLRRLGELGIPGVVPRRGTDSQTIRLFQREESSWEVNQSHRHGWDWRRGCRNNPRAWLQPYPQRAPKLGVLVTSRLSRRNKKDGFVNVLFCGEVEGGRGVGEVVRTASHVGLLPMLLEGWTIRSEVVPYLSVFDPFPLI